MYIVAIAWLYVTVLMALTESSVVAGLATFFFYGLVPLALFLWLAGTPQRRRARQRQEMDEARRELDAGASPPAAERADDRQPPS
jgi:ABC-type transport system involved in cytochrome c biogenesis permease subunit